MYEGIIHGARQGRGYSAKAQQLAELLFSNDQNVANWEINVFASLSKQMAGSPVKRCINPLHMKGALSAPPP
jgi:hypothetical protein